MRYTIQFIFLFVLAGGCIERFELPVLSLNPILVVDGAITSDPGPYKVTLYRPHVTNRIIKIPEYVTQATVQIFDDQGNSEMLTETLSGGEYYTSANGMRGTIGRKYHIKIVTADGKEYATQPQLMTAPGRIENLRYELWLNALNRDDVFKPQHAVKFLIDSKGGAEQSNFLRWRWTTTYEIRDAPHEKTRVINRSGLTVPDPPPCSGMRPGSNGLESFGPCTCCTCWVVNNSYGVLLSNNRFYTSREFNDLLMATVPLEPRTFDLRFHIRVDQLSLTEETYQYWKLAHAQEIGNGSLFVPNAIRMQGNVFSLTNPDEHVLGVFSVEGITSASMFINSRELPYEALMEERKESCLTFPRSTNVKPPFW